MKQILQSPSSGGTFLEELPAPQALPGQVVIRTQRSLISSGTERTVVEFSKASLFEKARQQPEKVKRIFEKMASEGVAATLDAIHKVLDQPATLGYCNYGHIVAVGNGVTEFALGERVVSNGPHAEVVQIPVNLCARVPDTVSGDDAVFTVLASIGLQGIRLAEPTLGERFVVMGLGAIGQLIVQMLRAHSCPVLGVDLDESKCALARQFGAQTVNLSKGEDLLALASEFSNGRGVDGVIIATATSSHDPLHHAAQMCRKRGRIVLVGVTGLNLRRNDFYEKELSFQVSCSYGPGRYDSNYEQKGIDYPFGLVRWTEKRNFEAVLDLMAENKIISEPLISHRFPFEKAKEAYDLLSSKQPSLAILLDYSEVNEKNESRLSNPVIQLNTVPTLVPGQLRTSFIGAGSYASQILIPCFKKAQAQLKTLVTTGNPLGVHKGRISGFKEASTDSHYVFRDAETDIVVIATRHNSHCELLLKALEAGKHVFVEKPLAINSEQLQAIQSQYHQLLARGQKPILMVGFNRRFAPQIKKIKELLLAVSAPKTFIMTVNAGAIPPDHWTQSLEVGGGRIIGEGCHFVDLLRFLANAPIIGVEATMLGADTSEAVRDDKVTITLSFSNGSIGTIHYFANGSRSFPKERLEIFCAGRILQLDNFRKLTGYDWPGFRKYNLFRQDKGQASCVTEFLHAIRTGGPSPIPFEELIEVTQVTFEIMKKLNGGRPS